MTLKKSDRKAIQSLCILGWESMVELRYLGRTVKLDELQVVISQALLALDFTAAQCPVTESNRLISMAVVRWSSKNS